MKTSYKTLFSLFLLLNFGSLTLLTSQNQEIQVQIDSSDLEIAANKGQELLKSHTLSQQLARIELKALLAKVKNDINHAAECLSNKDYTTIMHLLQKKKKTLDAQIKTLELTLPKQPLEIDIEDLLQKSFTIVAGSVAVVTLVCIIIQSSRENGQYHLPSLSRLMKNIRS